MNNKEFLEEVNRRLATVATTQGFVTKNDLSEMLEMVDSCEWGYSYGYLIEVKEA